MEVMDRLVRALGKLPGIGRRSAERIAVRIASSPGDLAAELASALEQARRELIMCSNCGAITSSGADPCRNCSDSSRATGVVYVVEEAGDVLALEKAGGLGGRFHVLHGKLSPMAGKGPWSVSLDKLVKRVEIEGFSEVVLALNTDMESDATADFIGELLKDKNVRVTRLAFGLPVGSGIKYSDPVTLERAIKGRREV